MYKDGYQEIREQMDQLPELLKHILLLIDLDTELNMNGIAGYLENASGGYLDEIIGILKRMNNQADYRIMLSIREILATNGMSLGRLRAQNGDLIEHEVSHSETKTGRAFGQCDGVD